MKRQFVNYFPVLFFLPISLVMGAYLFHEYDVLSEARPVYFYYYLAIAAAPLYFFVFHPRQDLFIETADVFEKIKTRFLKEKWIYLLIGVAFSVFYLYIASIHISTYYERDRWILHDAIPVLPIDLVLPPRLALISSWIFPTDIAIPFVNLGFILLWYVFLVYINEGEANSWLIVFLVLIITVLSDVLFRTLYAIFEFPAAVLGFIGLYGIWRRKVNLGLYFLFVGGVFKNTGIFLVATGMFLLALILWEDRSFRKFFSRFDFSLLFFLFIFFVANYLGVFYYIFVMRGGSDYIIEPGNNQLFLISSLSAFIGILLKDYPLLFLLGLLGSILDKRHRVVALVLIGLLMVLRSFSRLVDSWYVMMFIPSFSFFSVLGLMHIRKISRSRWVWSVFSIFIVVFSIFKVMGLLSSFPTDTMHHKNSNFDEFIGTIAEKFPRNGRILQREISLTPYLHELGRASESDIKFEMYPEDKDVTVASLMQPGCILIVMSKNDLGITEEELRTLGYSDQPYSLKDESGLWAAYSKDCGDG